MLVDIYRQGEDVQIIGVGGPSFFINKNHGEVVLVEEFVKKFVDICSFPAPLKYKEGFK